MTARAFDQSLATFDTAEVTDVRVYVFGFVWSLTAMRDQVLIFVLLPNLLSDEMDVYLCGGFQTGPVSF